MPTPWQTRLPRETRYFHFFIVNEIPAGLKGLIIAAIIAAAMSTVDSALNCSATVTLLDVYKKYFKPEINDKAAVLVLRLTTVMWGVLGTGFALLMIRAKKRPGHLVADIGNLWRRHTWAVPAGAAIPADQNLAGNYCHIHQHPDNFLGHLCQG